MPDIPSGSQDPLAGLDDALFTIKDVAALTGRHPELIRQWAKSGILRTVPDPNGGKRRLIPFSQLEVASRRREIGYETRSVPLTWADGRRQTIRVKVAKKP